MNALTLRPYAPDDREAVIALLRLNTPAYFAPEEELDLEYYLAHELELYFVVETANKVIGCGGINFWEEGTVARISWDIIHPDHHGKGVGRELVGFRLEQLRGYPDVKTVVVRTTQFVFRFYEKMGFTLREVEKNYWAEGFDLYQMERTNNREA